MRIIYQGIDLLVLETREINFQSVYDDSGTDYLYTRVTVVVRALVNGQAQVVNLTAPNGPFLSYDFTSAARPPSVGPSRTPDSFTFPFRVVSPDDPPTPGAISTTPVGAGIDRGLATQLLRGIARVPNAPPLTHQVIRHRLSTSKGKLFIFSGPGMESGVPAVGSSAPPPAPAILMLQSPVGTLECDCKNGPTPHLLDLVEATGDAQTFVVDWACETFVRDDDINQTNPRGPLLSNRFSQTHLVDDEGYTTIGTEGMAIFRTDRVYGTPVAPAVPPNSPDHQRPILFMPIPLGFVRENILVTGEPDVSGIRYSYQDRQMPVNFVAGPYLNADIAGVQGRGAAKIAAVHRQAVTSNVDILGGALTVYERTLSLLANRRFARGDADKEGGVKDLEKAIARGVRRGLRAKAKGDRPGGG